MTVVDLTRRNMSREAALQGFSPREQRMIIALEQIATGDAGSTTQTLEVAREIAIDVLQKSGWPTVRDD